MGVVSVRRSAVEVVEEYNLEQSALFSYVYIIKDVIYHLVVVCQNAGT